MSPRLKRAFYAFLKEITQADGRLHNNRCIENAYLLFDDLHALATDRNNTDGTIAPPLTTDEENEIINMMII